MDRKNRFAGKAAKISDLLPQTAIPPSQTGSLLFLCTFRIVRQGQYQ